MQPFAPLYRLAFFAAIVLASLSLVSAASLPVRRQEPTATVTPTSTDGHNRPAALPVDTTVAARSLAERSGWKNWRKYWRHNPWDKDYQQKHPCRTRSGIIRVYNDTDDSELGFVNGDLDGFGLLGLTTNVSNALDVSFQICTKKCGVIGPLDIKTDNPDVKFFGGVVGIFSTNNDLDVGSSNYEFLAGISKKTKPGSPAQPGTNTFSTATGSPENSASAIWYLDLASNEITAQWVNANGTEPNTHIVYAPLDDDFVITGDVPAYQSRFNGDGVYFILDED